MVGKRLRDWWAEQMEALRPIGLADAVHSATSRHLAEFGYEGLRVEHGRQVAIATVQHCLISFYYHHEEVGSYLMPRSYERAPDHRKLISVDLVYPIPDWRVADEVDRQMRIIVERYANVLNGEHPDWK